MSLKSVNRVSVTFPCARWLQALGVTSTRRSAEFPDVPAVAESVPGYESTSWGVLIAPAKVPPAIIDKLNKEAVCALHLPNVKERLARLGAEVVGSTPAESPQVPARGSREVGQDRQGGRHHDGALATAEFKVLCSNTVS